MLMLAYSKPVPSGEAGSMVLEMHANRWPEVESEINIAAAHIRTAHGPGRFKRTVRYANDYECSEDGAAWSLVGCASPRKQGCPVCHRKVKPIAFERYVVLTWTPARLNV
jgi:hypothetical protein